MACIILSPRAVERLESYTPPWPLPKIFRMTSGGKLIAGIFEGETINTPSMLCVEDYIVALNGRKAIGGLQGAAWRGPMPMPAWCSAGSTSAASRRTLRATRRRAPIPRSASRSMADEAAPKTMVKLLETEGVAYDIGSYRDAPPGLRIWCGATVETSDVEALMPWLDWAYAQATAA